MQVIGYGISPDDWTGLMQSLRTALPALKMQGRCLEQGPQTPDAVREAGVLLMQEAPTLLAFRISAFPTADEAIFFVRQMQFRAGSALTTLLFVAPETNEVADLLKLAPEVQLSNGLCCILTDPSLLLSHHIRRFPRVRVDGEVRRLVLRRTGVISGTLTLEELPLNQPLPLTAVESVETASGATATELWLKQFLDQQSHPIRPAQIRGLLREEQGCFLFPGVPLNAVTTLSVDDVTIGHLLRRDGFQPSAYPFQRLVATLQEAVDSQKTEPILTPPNFEDSVRCLSTLPILNELTESVLLRHGYRDVASLAELPSGRHELESGLLWIQLTPFPNAVVRGVTLDWTEDLQEVVGLLDRHAETLKQHAPRLTGGPPLSRIELDQQLATLETKEKQLRRDHQLSRNRELIYTQEAQVLQKALRQSRKLETLLEHVLDWNQVSENPEVFRSPQALLLCEDEDEASEMMRRLIQVDRKRWLNPEDFPDPESLAQLSEVGLPALESECQVFATPEARTHWEILLRATTHAAEYAQAFHREQSKTQERLKLELEGLAIQRCKLVVQWLHGVLLRLLKRDQTRLRT